MVTATTASEAERSLELSGGLCTTGGREVGKADCNSTTTIIIIVIINIINKINAVPHHQKSQCISTALILITPKSSGAQL